MKPLNRTANRAAYRTAARDNGSLALGLITLFTPAMAEAQAAQAPQTARTAAKPAQDLGSFQVTDTAIDEGSYKTDRLDSPKATAPLVDTPRSITVIARQALDDTASASLTEALRMVPGIALGAGEGGNPLGDRPFIRGTDSSNSMYLDGVRDMSAQSREVFAVDSIEVTKGSDGVMNGGGNGGGSINLVSKTPQASPFARADISYGSANYKRATGDINLPISTDVALRVAAMVHDQDIAGRNAVWQKRWGVAPSIKFGLNGPTSLTLDWYHMHSNELPDQGIPYQYILANQPRANYETAPAGTDVRPRDAFYGLANRDFRTTNTDAVTGRFEHTLGNGFKLRNTARYTYTTQEYVWTLPDDSKGNVATSGLVARRVNSRYSSQTGLVDQADLSGKFATGGIQHSFALAAEYSWQKSSYGSFYANSSYTALPLACVYGAAGCSSANYLFTTLANPNPYDPYTGTIVKGPANSRTLANSSTASVSIFDTITLSKQFLLNLGGRYDHYLTHASAALASPFIGTRNWQTRQDDLFTYQAGLVFKPTRNGSLYISTSTSAIPPGSFLAQGSEDNAVAVSPTAAVQIDPNALKPQKTTSYEAGAKWTLFDNNLMLTLAVFQTRTTNARTTDPDTSLPLYVGTKRVRGVEVGFSGNITPEWSVFGGYTYQPSRVLDAGMTKTTVNGVSAYGPAAATGHPFPNTPEHNFTLFTNYKVTPRLTLGGGAMYVDKVYGGFSDSRSLANGALVITATRATYVPAYWRFDANAAYKINDHFSLRVNALNLTDKLYYDQAYTTHYAHQAAGRTVMGTLSVKY